MSFQKVPHIYIVILNWNGWRDTLACLESLHQINYPKYTTVVIDNGSQDDSFERISNWAKASCIEMSEQAKEYECEGEVTRCKCTSTQGVEVLTMTERFVLIRSDQNLGFAGGCNLGAEYAISAGAEYVWFLNSDTVVNPYSLTALLDCARSSGFDVVGSLVCRDEACADIEFAHGRLPWDLFGFAFTRTAVPQDRKTWPSDWVTFASVLISEKVISERVSSQGYFLDPDLFMYVEDVDFCFFCRARNFNVGVCKSGYVQHRTSSSSGDPGNPRAYYYITRNRIFVAKKWLSSRSYKLFIIYYVFTRMLLQCQHLTTGSFEKIVATTSGLVDGLRGRAGRWGRH